MRPAFDVIIVGGGPAGATAAMVLGRAGARVVVFDRATFPRDKLCGDTVNPGTLTLLRRLGVAEAAGTFEIRGMLVTGEGGVRVSGLYPPGISGRALMRRDLDRALLDAAAAAGARIEQGTLVRGAASGAGAVDGVYVAARHGPTVQVSAPVVIAADGRQSCLARSLGLGRYPPSPRRWAIGAYFTDVADLTDCGEMHIRAGKYIGVAALPGGVVNACVVSADRGTLRDPNGLLMRTLRTEPELRHRFAHARLAGPPTILGPLAVDCTAAGVPGLLLAGDAAGFIDPLTGDGLRFAIRGGELAAAEALRALEQGFGHAHVRLQAARAREFSTKWRFNRFLRGLTGSRHSVRLAAVSAAIAPAWVEHAIRYAGDAMLSIEPLGQA